MRSKIQKWKISCATKKNCFIRYFFPLCTPLRQKWSQNQQYINHCRILFLAFYCVTTAEFTKGTLKQWEARYIGSKSSLRKVNVENQVWIMEENQVKVRKSQKLAYLLYKKLIAKGQLISKANCQVVNSSKKRTNEFIFTKAKLF